MTATMTAPSEQINWRSDRPKKMLSLWLRISFGILTSMVIILRFFDRFLQA